MLTKQSLCIGINTYVPSYLTLRPCVNDATDLSDALRSIGFQAHHATDCDLNSMRTAFRRFVNSIQPGAVVLFYFSGHGVQYNGNNYLIPRDAVGICAKNVKSTAFDAQRVISSMYAKSPRLIICILDCCRTDPPTNPLADRKALTSALSGTKGGLAPMQAPPSTIIVYACAADDTASPRSVNGRNSLYTYHLLQYIKTPNVDIETILKYVAAGVQEESDNEQVPYRYSSCNEIIYLASNRKSIETLPTQFFQSVFIPGLFDQHCKKVSIQRSRSQHSIQHQPNGQLVLPNSHRTSVRTPSPRRHKNIPKPNSFSHNDLQHHLRRTS